MVRLGLPFILTLTFRLPHLHQPLTPRRPPLTPEPPPPSLPPVTTAANVPVSLQLQLRAARMPRCLWALFSFHHTQSLTTTFTSDPLSCTCPASASFSNALHKHSRTLTVSMFHQYLLQQFRFHTVFISPSFSFSTVGLSLPPTMDKPDDQTEIRSRAGRVACSCMALLLHSGPGSLIFTVSLLLLSLVKTLKLLHSMRIHTYHMLYGMYHRVFLSEHNC